jgi:hypothetical protein
MTVYTNKRATIVQVSTGAAYVLFSNLYEDVMWEVDHEDLDLDQSLLDDQIEVVSGPHGSVREAEDWCHTAGWTVNEKVVA